LFFFFLLNKLFYLNIFIFFEINLLVRKDCVDIIREVGKIEKIKNIAMTTNGILLSKRLVDLKQAGLNQLNISLDTLEEKKFEFIAKRKGWSRVMDSIHHALDLGYAPVKVNKTILRFADKT